MNSQPVAEKACYFTMEWLSRSKKILGKQEDIAGTVAFPACAEASFIAGQTLSVSGGLTMY